MNELISIIVPVHDVEDYIEKSVESIIHQEFKSFELILVNDGTKDNSIIKASNLLKNSNINYKILEQENRGVSSARNYGLQNCSGKYVIFLDSDDVISKNFLKELYKIIVDSDVDISICDFEFVKEQNIINNKNVDYVVYDERSFFNHFLVRDISFALPTMLIKKEILIKNDIIFDENQAFSEDQQFMWEVIILSKNIGYTKEKMYGYYLRPNSTMTGSSMNKILNGYHEYIVFCKKLEDKYKISNNIVNQILSRWIIGTLYTSSKVLNYDEFVTVYNNLFDKMIIKDMTKIKEIKAIMLSIILYISKRMSYIICKEVL